MFCARNLSFKMKTLAFLKIVNVKSVFALQYRAVSNAAVILQPLFRSFDLYSNNIAVVDNVAKYKYSDILHQSRHLARQMREISPSLCGDRKTVSFLCDNDVSYVHILLACWLNGNIAVPLCKEHPSSLLEYFLSDSKSSLVICTPSFVDQIQPLSFKLEIPLLKATKPLDSGNLMTESTEMAHQEISNSGNSGAVIIYTSGTTGPPKGVLLTHGNLQVQVNDIVKAWDWNSNDVILNVLPLHHVHGFLYCLLCPLAIGATVVMMPKFEAMEVWKYFLNINDNKAKINMFSAVPTVYTKLINKYEEFCSFASLERSEIQKRCVENVRLMVAGSSALPDTVFHEWQQLTGHVILERYGMSEIGMALSNPLLGERIAGTVGSPLPAVQVRIAKPLSSSVDEDYEILVESADGKTKVSEGREGEPGDLHIKGQNVFAEYWMKPKARAGSFTKDGWFKTGDVAVCEKGIYRILGRASSDIIKTGGYKVSALDIERYLLEQPAVSECTVFGLPNEEWGEVVVAVLAVHPGKKVLHSELKDFCKTKLPPYSVPKIFKIVDSIPRNVTGKVNKKELREFFLNELKDMVEK